MRPRRYPSLHVCKLSALGGDGTPPVLVPNTKLPRRAHQISILVAVGGWLGLAATFAYSAIADWGGLSTDSSLLTIAGLFVAAAVLTALSREHAIAIAIAGTAGVLIAVWLASVALQGPAPGFETENLVGVVMAVTVAAASGVALVTQARK